MCVVVVAVMAVGRGPGETKTGPMRRKEEVKMVELFGLTCILSAVTSVSSDMRFVESHIFVDVLCCRRTWWASWLVRGSEACLVFVWLLLGLLTGEKGGSFVSDGFLFFL